MNRDDKIFFAVLEYVSKTSKAEACADFVKEVLEADEECRKALTPTEIKPKPASSTHINTGNHLLGGF